MSDQGAFTGLGRGTGTFERTQAGCYSFGWCGVYCHVLYTKFVSGKNRVIGINGKEFISRSVQAGVWIGVEGLSPLVPVGTLAWLLVGLFDGTCVSMVRR